MNGENSLHNLSRLIGSASAPAGSQNLLALSDMEMALKNMVKLRVMGHLNAGARDSVLARDATRFCNQISAQIKGVSESKEI